jgi:hypothetical protein
MKWTFQVSRVSIWATRFPQFSRSHLRLAGAVWCLRLALRAPDVYPVDTQEFVGWYPVATGWARMCQIEAGRVHTLSPHSEPHRVHRLGRNYDSLPLNISLGRYLCPSVACDINREPLRLCLQATPRIHPSTSATSCSSVVSGGLKSLHHSIKSNTSPLGEGLGTATTIPSGRHAPVLVSFITASYSVVASSTA